MSSEATFPTVDSTAGSTDAVTSTPESSNLSGSKSAYIPPHLRHKLPDLSASAAATLKMTTPEVVPEKKPFQRKTFTASEIYKHFGVVHGGTINPSINNHKELAYILIFRNQHPQYPPKIFVKSNLELIFDNASQGNEINPLLEHMEIPLFEEEHQYRSKLFKFKSWVRIQKVESGFEMQEREKSRREEKLKKENAAITKTVEVGADGEETVVENRFFKDDPDDSEDKQPQRKLSGSGKITLSDTILQNLEKTTPRSEIAWRNSLNVDWGIVTLEFIENGKENPLYGPPVKLLPYNTPKEPQPPKDDISKEIDDVSKATGFMKLDDIEKNVADGKKTIRGTRGDKNEKVKISKALQTDGADDAVLVNDDLDSASIPSSPVLEPATPKKGSAINLSAYALQTSGANPRREKPSHGGGLSISQSDISQSYISTGMGDSMADDFGTISAPSETEAEESDRWSELDEHDHTEDENWMAVERGGMAKEVY
ncbi:hypothetical protein TWF970_010542 [Orbilia oligospora]|uniref:Uncharacterized protein n=1 Tax=Orbilia oligospora TaxID=2813651 RepID=A0A7C8VBH9_ORBOL|nr:hypothetical protein TWF970_010542 [Orbilia oligospora]